MILELELKEEELSFFFGNSTSLWTMPLLVSLTKVFPISVDWFINNDVIPSTLSWQECPNIAKVEQRCVLKFASS